MGYYDRVKDLVHHRVFILNTIHRRKTVILYLSTVLSIIQINPFPLDKRILLSSGRGPTPSLFVLPMRLTRKKRQCRTPVKGFSLSSVELLWLIWQKDLYFLVMLELFQTHSDCYTFTIFESFRQLFNLRIGNR